MQQSRMLTIAEATNEALREEMRLDDKVYVLGEGVSAEGGAFRVTSGLQQEFGDLRVRDMPTRCR